jgi:hypothetical protein
MSLTHDFIINSAFSKSGFDQISINVSGQIKL